MVGTASASAADVWSALKDPSRSILASLERSGEVVDEAFVARWVDRRSEDVVAELDAHAAWRTVFVGDCSGYGVREDRIGDILDAGVVHFQGNTSSGEPLLVFKAQRYDAARFSSCLPLCLVYAMDAAIRCADKRVNPKRQVVWLFDLEHVSRKNCSIEFLESVFTLFQQHYPECLSKLYFVNAPFLFWGLWAVACVFLEQKTRDKVEFCRSRGSLALSRLSPDVVPEAYGGRAKLRSLRRAVAMVRQGRMRIPDDSDAEGEEWEQVPIHPLKSTLFWVLFSLCLVVWVFVKLWDTM